MNIQYVFNFILIFAGLHNALAEQVCSSLQVEGFLTGQQKTLTIIAPRGQGGGSHQLSSKMAQVLESKLDNGIRVEVKNISGDHGIKAIKDYLRLPANG